MTDTFIIYEVFDWWDEPETSIGFYSSRERAQQALNAEVEKDFIYEMDKYNRDIEWRQNQVNALRISMQIPDTITDDDILAKNVNFVWYRNIRLPDKTRIISRYKIREVTVNED
jgi:hypothetical protein